MGGSDAQYVDKTNLKKQEFVEDYCHQSTMYSSFRAYVIWLVVKKVCIRYLIFLFSRALSLASSVSLFSSHSRLFIFTQILSRRTFEIERNLFIISI